VKGAVHGIGESGGVEYEPFRFYLIAMHPPHCAQKLHLGPKLWVELGSKLQPAQKFGPQRPSSKATKSNILKELSVEERQMKQAHKFERTQLNHLAGGGARGRGRPRKAPRRKQDRAKQLVVSGYEAVGASVQAPQVAPKVMPPNLPNVYCFTSDWTPNFAQAHLPVETRLATANGPAPKAVHIDTGAFRSQRMKTGSAWADAVLNGCVSDKDVRYPDPFTLTKTYLFQTSHTTSVSTAAGSSGSSSSSYDWTVSGIFKGSCNYSLMMCGPPSGNGYNYDWATGHGTWLGTGMNSSDFYTRPNGYVVDIVPRLTGVSHTARLFAFPLQPFWGPALTSSTVVGWPSTMNTGLTPAQVSWGGREFEIDSTTKGIRLCSLPVDSRCFDFKLGNTERMPMYEAYGLAWAGWLFWVTGCTQADKFDIVVNSLEEAFPITTTSTAYAYSGSDTLVDSAARDRHLMTMKAANTSGLSGYSLIDSVVDFAKDAWGIGKKLYGAWQAAAPFAGAMCPTTECLRASHAAVPEEEKIDDFTPIDPLVKVRRNTLSTPLMPDLPKEQLQPPVSARRTK